MSEASYMLAPYPGYELPSSYRGLVVSRWVRTLKYKNAYFKLIDPKSYWSVYPAYVAKLLERPDVVVTLALLTDDPDVALGYAVHEGTKLHYVHVDKDQRRQGIGSALVEKLEIEKLTHVTEFGISFWSARLPKAVFDPFA